MLKKEENMSSHWRIEFLTNDKVCYFALYGVHVFKDYRSVTSLTRKLSIRNLGNNNKPECRHGHPLWKSDNYVWFNLKVAR